MKTTNILLSLAVMGTLTLGFAASDTAINETVAAQQEAMQNATPEERAALMNQLKEQLHNMSAEDRAAAMEQMQANGAQNIGEMREMGQEHRQEMQMEHAQEMTMEHAQEMNRAQNMNQQQAGSQYAHENERGGGSIITENVQSSDHSWNY